ncbi:site-specific integrase [Seonamhaeicola maritimus]|uniref:Site-specific integrase n=1 Tax=Seonamhaeicola maritimus TaxID=2591822 RepID=A0A5C7GG51_9FLAO|nr:site-specific integrase [Seonamhaeicola maritimus]TXG36720.1 site-specific integrase [Seonamhaeicola maritimus]
MYKMTQLIINSLNYNQILSNLLADNPSSKNFPENVLTRLITIIGMTSGLTLIEIVNLKWSDILAVDSRNRPKINKKYRIERHYEFPINAKLHNQLAIFYNYLNQPQLQTRIIDCYQESLTIETLLLRINITLGIKWINGIKKDVVVNYKNEQLLQILFGRRVMEVCGSTNKINTYLKWLFKLENNQQLFNFLGFKSKDDIHESISNISLIEDGRYAYLFGEPSSFLDDDKHFLSQNPTTNEFYTFQHFQVFYEFLNGVKIYKYNIVTQGIVILLLISLTNGIRLSTLLNLRWSDLFDINQDTFEIKLKKTITFNKKELLFHYSVLKKILFYFENAMKYFGFNGVKISGEDSLSFQQQTPNLELPVFITNRGNRLVRNSLNRELKKALNGLDFQHTDKFALESTLIMYGRRIIELKGIHRPTLRLLKKRLNFRTTLELFKFLEIDEQKGNDGQIMKEFESVHDHILYNK